MQTKEEYLCMARVAEQADRYEDMYEAMKKVIAAEPLLNAQERKLLSIAFRNVVLSRKEAWRSVRYIEYTEKKKGSKNISVYQDQRIKIESELDKYCSEILNLIESSLIPNGKNLMSNIQYIKMKGDYSRYHTQILSGDKKKNAVQNAEEAYRRATEIAQENLRPSDPFRLSLALNFSVFYYEAKEDSQKACQMAQQAFEEAMEEIDQIAEEEFNDSSRIMRLLEDNVKMWTAEMQEGYNN